MIGGMLSNTVDGVATQLRLRSGTSGNCGVTLVYGLPSDPDKTEFGSYPITHVLPFDLACVAAKHGYNDPTNLRPFAQRDLLVAFLQSKIGSSASVYMFTDVDGCNNGLRCRDWLVKKGYTVETIDVGPNYNYPALATGAYHFIRIFLWYDWDHTKKLHPVSTVREFRLEEEKQEPIGAPEPGARVPDAAIRQPRRADGEGVRGAGPGGPVIPVRGLAGRASTKF